MPPFRNIQTKHMESSIGIITKGYPYFKEKFEKEGTYIIKTRLLLQRAYVIKGHEAARLFYNNEYFRRKKATPKRFQKTLFGEGGVQGLDGEKHLQRKSMFMQHMNDESLQRIESLFATNWNKAQKEWARHENIVLFHEAEQVLFKTACEWTGVPFDGEDAGKLTSLLSAMIDASGGVGWRHYKGRHARSKAEHWLKQIIIEVRHGKRKVSSDSVLKNFIYTTDTTGNLLPSGIVAVEILNLLRPIVAIARYIVFIAHALHKNADYAEKLKVHKELNHWFVQEVRRYYPFFPFVAAKTVKSFNWHKVHFKKNTRVLLDLYSTNHDDNLWPEPDKFNPYRFQGNNIDSFNLIPQGGGDFNTNHRCAGEWITIRIMEKSLDLLVNQMKYTVPPQDLSIAQNRIPAIPESRFIIKLLK